MTAVSAHMATPSLRGRFISAAKGAGAGAVATISMLGGFAFSAGAGLAAGYLTQQFGQAAGAPSLVADPAALLTGVAVAGTGLAGTFKMVSGKLDSYLKNSTHLRKDWLMGGLVAGALATAQVASIGGSVFSGESFSPERLRDNMALLDQMDQVRPPVVTAPSTTLPPAARIKPAGAPAQMFKQGMK